MSTLRGAGLLWSALLVPLAVTASPSILSYATYLAGSSANAVVIDSSGNTLVAGNGQVTVPWTAPSCANGSTIGGYTVVWGLSQSSLTLGSASVSNSTFSHVVSGLTNGTPYYFAVYATSNLGNGVGVHRRLSHPLPLWATCRP